jgi:hypothetical protein
LPFNAWREIGTATINNDAFAVICFNAHGALSSIVRPGYDMEFHDFKTFGKKRIAYREAYPLNSDNAGPAGCSA